MAVMEGRVILAQESRFQLMGRDGVAHHFVLGHAAGADPEQLGGLQQAQARVRVGYHEAADVHARVATRIDLLDALAMDTHQPSALDYFVPDESEITAGVRIVPGRSYGFFTDTTLCIGCKACEVACKEWNNLPADHVGLTGNSYDNTGALSANTWRHVSFIEKAVRDDNQPAFQSGWLMMSDVCKHCHNAPCQEACPTGALFRTEFDTVVVQQDICNGCGYCVPACPFGVVDLSTLDGKAHKCTLCYDRLKGGLEPACAKACPTDSIQFGEIGALQQRAAQRVERLHGLGVDAAYLYGTPGAPGATGDLGHLNAFFLLTDKPEVYNLPSAPNRASNRFFPSITSGLLAVAGMAFAAAALFTRRR